jgi:YVTN family beta-propeller protein
MLTSSKLARRARRWLPPVLLALAGTAAWIWVRAAEENREPVYVGVRVCAQCHHDQAGGDQFSRWLMSRHSQAFAMLAKPEARGIARLSGIPVEPQESPLCLGCHATGADAEPWEKDPTFYVQEGVQCEKCHGPGSEYSDAQVMMDRQAAMMAGLRMPTKADCMSCHNVKGSHVAVHSKPKLNMDEAWQTVAHPTPEGYKFEMVAKKNNPGRAATRVGPKYTGSIACAKCHTGSMMGYQYSRWRMSDHARAYATLATLEAQDVAKQMGVMENPQKSPACLKCHSTAGNPEPGTALESYTPAEGVGCEACHGPGSEYSLQAVMMDKRAAMGSGLKPVTPETCLPCHRKGHEKSFDAPKAIKAIEHPTRLMPIVLVDGEPDGKVAAPKRTFDIESAWKQILHPTKLAKTIEEPMYKTPLNLALRPDGKELYVACEGSGTVIVVDTRKRQKVAEIAVGGEATDVAFSPDGRRAYVSSRLEDSVAVIDVAARKLVEKWRVGDEPHGVLTVPTGKYLYVLNTAEESVSVVDTTTGKEMRRLTASRNPWSLALSPDGRHLLVTNTLSRALPFRDPAKSEVTAIEAEHGVVEDRYVLPGANYLQGVAWHPSGEFAFVTLMRTKNLVPMTRILQGWTITNGLGIVWRDGRTDQVLLDEPQLYFPDPTDVAFTPDGRWALVTSSGSDCVAVVDVSKLVGMLKQASAYEREHVFPNHLGKPTEFIVKHIATRNSPRGIVVSPDGRMGYVANALDDSLTVIDIEKLAAVGRVDLGGPKVITDIRRGERLFHSARITFRRQFSCHSCHPDGHVNGLTFDIEPDGIGISPVDNRTLRGVLDTAPFKWEGTNPTLARECGPRLSVFFTRIQPFTPEELSALVHYISTIPRPPNRYRPLGAPLTEAQRRGREVFYRTRKNSGEEIPVGNRCATCHRGPMFTDRQVHNIGSKMMYDRVAKFDTPHLNNIYDSAPYLHNGMADTLEEIWTRYNPNDTHGVTNDMTKDQLNDLIEFLKTL